MAGEAEKVPVDALVGFLNRTAATLIDLDPDGRRNLARLQGKTLCLDITAPSLQLYLKPVEAGLEFVRQLDGEPDVVLSGTILAFAGMANREKSGDVLGSGQVRVEGDAETGQAFQKALAELDIDWEELLSRYIGDTPARKIGNVLRGIAGWARDSAERSRENLGDLLAEEKRVLVSRVAMDRFERETGRLRADTDRLQQRIDRLKQMLSPRNGGS